MQKLLSLPLLAALSAFPVASACQGGSDSAAAATYGAPGTELRQPGDDSNEEEMALATFAGGCFWCMELPFEKVPGVGEVISGYAGGHVVDPTYEAVCTGKTGHTEVVQVHYSPDRVSYEDLLQVFWRQIDPTDGGGQFVDRGNQYRSEIFYHNEAQRRAAESSKSALAKSGRFKKPIATGITALQKFYPAEEYHQNFYEKDPGRYKRYRAASGRDRFLDAAWGSERVWKVSEPTAFWEAFSKPSSDELRDRLTALQYRVTQEEGTERPFSNEFWDNKAEGLYVDIVSGEPLFSSKDKFKSGTGWPSFTRPVLPELIREVSDNKLFAPRVEVRSKHADSHLGHVFTDGPEPTGLRYCINSASLRFVPRNELKKQGYGSFAAGF